MNLSLYQLVYRNVCDLPLELEHKAFWAIKFLNFDAGTTWKKRLLQSHELEEIRVNAYQNAEIYKERTKKYHDNQKQFYPGQKVLLFNLKLKLFAGKLRYKWTKPFKVIEAFLNEAVELEDPESKSPFKVNGQRLKIYLEHGPREDD